MAYSGFGRPRVAMLMIVVSLTAAQAQQIYNCDATGLIPQPQKLTEEVAVDLGVSWPPESPQHFLVQETQGDGAIFWSDTEKDALFDCQPIQYAEYICENFGEACEANAEASAIYLG